MRSGAALASITAVALAGCGGNSTGVAGGTGIESSSGSSQGNGSATGNGSTDPQNAGSVDPNGGTTTSGGYVPQSCDLNARCPSGERCYTPRDSLGYCVIPCTLPEGIDVGKAICPGSSFCVTAGQGSLGSCVLPCGTDTDCPTLTGLEASCAYVVKGGPTFCVWGPLATPGG